MYLKKKTLWYFVKKKEPLTMLHKWTLSEINVHPKCQPETSLQENKDEIDEPDECDESDESDELDEEEDEIKDKCNCVLFLEPAIFQLSEWYQFEKRIFSNASKAIYKAIDRTSKVDVCIKIFVHEDLTKPVPKEICMLEYIRRCGGHPNVQQLIDVFDFKIHDQQIWIMVTGFHTEDCIRTCVYGQHLKMITFTKQLLEATFFLHQIGIMHRDLKPHNILWRDQDQHLLLMDFDLAAWIRPKGRTVVCGTKGFRAPEMLLQKRDAVLHPQPYSKEIDLFSIGCICICLFFQVRESELSEAMVCQFRSKLDNVPLIQSLLEQNPSARMTLEHALVYLSTNQHF
jgi:serine/threonine protein kinase